MKTAKVNAEPLAAVLDGSFGNFEEICAAKKPCRTFYMAFLFFSKLSQEKLKTKFSEGKMSYRRDSRG